MAILTVLTRLLDHTLEGARIIDMGTTKTCQCFVLPRDGMIEDIDITSEKRMPSHPASVIADTSRQGTTAFVDKNGKTFGERYPK